MEIMVLIILIGVVLIDGKLWKIMAQQSRHDKAQERLLTEIRDRLASRG